MLRRLQCSSQRYDWGKLGSSSMVARLITAGSSNAEVKISESEHFAELWMGTHPSGPSSVFDDKEESEHSVNETLQSYLTRNSSALGVEPYSLTTGALPYLFKVLSIEKALSIQAHPDSKLAKKLHSERPNVYKDPNHKPEMACALTTFEAMCSFRPPSEIASNIKRVPELVLLVGGNEKAATLTKAADLVTTSNTEENIANFALELKTAYSTLMTQPVDVVDEAFSLLKTRLEKEAINTREEKTELVQLDESNPFSKLTADACALRLCSQYPGDVGVFSPFLLNVITLQPGDAIFLGANEPHAYLSGDCIEIMACSDNVVRAGLTPKFKDVSILCEMLTYKCGQPEILKGITFQKKESCVAREYTAPVPEFMLQQFLIPKGESQSSLLLPSVLSAAVLIVINGSGIIESIESNKDIPIKRISQGQVLLQHAGTQMTLSSSNTDIDLLVFRASVAAS